MRATNSLLILILLTSFTAGNHVIAGGIPLTSNDPNLEVAINSSADVLDVLGNDDSGLSNDNFKEVVGVCDTNTSDQMCTANSYTDGIGSVSINGAGDNNNVLFSSNSSTAATFEFKYVMQNSVNNTGTALASVDLSFVEVNSLSDAGSNGCDGTECTLREAFEFAVFDLVPTTIKFSRNLTGTITLTAPLTVTSIDLSVIGPGPGKITVSGDNTFRVLLVPGMSERFFISGLTITGGHTTAPQPGAGIFIDGATDTQIENIRITNNEAGSTGGGLYVLNASLSLKNSEISHNLAGLNGGGLAILGGLGSDVFIENTTVSNNESLNEGDGIHINSNNGQNVTLRYVTSAFNTGTNIDNFVGPNGNIIIESSVFKPQLNINNTNNIVNNSVMENLSGSNLLGDNNEVETFDLLLNPLTELNNSGVKVHTFNTESILYNHVDNMFGNSGCGTQVTADQVGNARPNEGACDAGAYEYTFIDLIFASDFE